MSDINQILQKLEQIEQSLKAVVPVKEVMCMQEVANYLQMAPSYLYKLTHGRKIPFYKPQGKLIYFKRSEVDDWVLQNRIKTELELEEEADNLIFNKKN